MLKKNLISKSIACSVITGLVYGAFTYSEERFTPKKVELTAFANAYKNFQELSSIKKASSEEVVTYNDVTGTIVKTIEKEVRGKIYRSRLAFTAERVIAQTKINSVKPIAKNWNEIRPTFPELKPEEKKLTINSIVENEKNVNEINNKELIRLSAFSFESQFVVRIADLEIPASLDQKNEIQTAENKNEIASNVNIVNDETVDEVAVSQSAPESIPETSQVAVEDEKVEVADTEKDNGDDMVMFDYSSKNAPKKIFDAPLSANVKNAIERELSEGSKTVGATSKPISQQSIQSKKTISDKELESLMANEDATVIDYASKKQAAIETKKEVSRQVAAFMAPEETTEKITFELEAKEINLNTQKIRSATGFEFVPDYERSERMDDQAVGKITFDYSLDSNLSIQTGVVQSLGNIPTRIELDLLKGDMSIPLINEEGIQKFLEKKSLPITGSLILLAIDESIQDVELDKDYQAKIFFNAKFKIVESIKNASYVMLLGVNPGNTMIRYILSNNDSSQKIIYLGDGELYYEDPGFKASEREVYSFTTRSLLGKKTKELNIDSNQVSFFGAKISSKKKALNAYEIKVPTIVDNDRKYLEFKHVNSNLYVGTNEIKDIEIPSLDFINKVLDQKSMRQMGQRCLVQINLTKEVRDIKANGKNKLGEMFVETNFLDTDGNFTDETPEMAEKIFIGGDQEGIMNIRLDFTDGSTGFLKTFCSEGSYLVEQI